MTSEQSELCSDVVPVVGLRPRKLRIIRLAVCGKAHSLCCSFFPHGNRLAGLPWGPAERGRFFTTPQTAKDPQSKRTAGLLVPVVGLEPTPCRQERILSPSRLPFHHTGERTAYYTGRGKEIQEISERFEK